jgi:(p)ppGpp synthase/HD superfamily hydrolase
MATNPELVYLTGWAKGSPDREELLRAIYAAKTLHEGQFRKSGEPYIDHPVRVTASLVARGITEIKPLAAAMLHDGPEDCDVDILTLQTKYLISKDTTHVIALLTKMEGVSTDAYYRSISESPEACIVKAEDRCHNVSTMVSVFTPEKLWKYIDETRNYVIPLCKHARRAYPQYSDQIVSIKYHIMSVVDAIEFQLKQTNPRTDFHIQRSSSGGNTTTS